MADYDWVTALPASSLIAIGRIVLYGVVSGEGCDLNNLKRLPTPRRCVHDWRTSTGSAVAAVRASRPSLVAAQRNLFERDRMFTDRLSEEVKRLDLPAIEIDTPMTMDDLAGRVTEVFRL
jgi:hypothetical protein